MDSRGTYVGSTFSLRNRIGRVLWSVVTAVLFKFSPKPLYGWRSFLLRCFGARIGKKVHIYPGAKVWAPWNLEVGDASAIASGAIIYSQGKIIIGRNAVISQGAHICAGTHDYNQPDFPLTTRPIVIKDYAWVAAEAFVHPGVIIHTGCVIGARSVVNKDMPEWMVCAGFPCKPICDRNNISKKGEKTNRIDTAV